MKFKVGDLVECVDSTGNEGILLKGKIYEVSTQNGSYISLKNGNGHEWFAHRFKLISHAPGSMNFKNPYEYPLTPDEVWINTTVGTTAKTWLDNSIIGGVLPKMLDATGKQEKEEFKLQTLKKLDMF